MDSFIKTEAAITTMQVMLTRNFPFFLALNIYEYEHRTMFIYFSCRHPLFHVPEYDIFKLPLARRRFRYICREHGVDGELYLHKAERALLQLLPRTLSHRRLYYSYGAPTYLDFFSHKTIPK